MLTYLTYINVKENISYQHKHSILQIILIFFLKTYIYTKQHTTKNRYPLASNDFTWFEQNKKHLQYVISDKNKINENR